MTFTIVCNNCKSEATFKQHERSISESIEVGFTEHIDGMGPSVETIDIYCSNCENEINMK